MKRSDDDRIEFLNELPINLRIKVYMIMKFDMLIILAFFYYASTYSCWCRVFRSIFFLITLLLNNFSSKTQNPRFIAFIGPLLRPLKVGRGEIICNQGEYANESTIHSYFCWVIYALISVFYQIWYSYARN